MKHKCTGVSLQNCEIPKQLIFQDGKDIEWRGETEDKCFTGETSTKERGKGKGNYSSQWKKERRLVSKLK